MRRFTSFTLAASAAATLALAQAVAAAPPPHEFVAGAAQQGVNADQISAQNHSSQPQDATGTMSFKPEGQERVRIDVTCLVVTGNQAVVSGLITTPAAQAGNVVVADVRDNGEPSGGTPPDLLRFSFPPFVVPSGPAGCYEPVLAPVPIQQGNFVVTDD